MVYTPATAKYPTTIATVADIGLFTNDEGFRLLAATTAATTTFSVDDASGFAAGMWVPIRGINGLEICQITAVQLSPAQITVTRGKDGTVAIAHNHGERGIAGVPAISLNQLVAEVIAIQTFLGTLTTTGFVTLAGAQTITGLKSITDGVRFNIGTTTSAITGGIPGFQHTASSQYLDILTANVRLSDNRLILLTANDGTANEGADLIQFHALQATDRSKIMFYDYLGNRAVMQNFHHTDFNSGSIHRAWEIKSNDGSGNQTTRLSIQYKVAPADQVEGSLSVFDVWTNYDIVDYRWRQRSNTPITHNFNKWRDTTNDLFICFTARYSTDGADGTLIDMDPKTFDNAKNTKWRYFRNVNNTAGGGAATVEWHAGDGTSNVQVKLDLKAGRMSWGDGTAFLADLAHANTAARTYTFPDASTTVAGLSVANVFTANQSISKSNPQITLVDTVNANAGTSTILSQSLGPGMRLAFDLTPNVAGDATNIAFFRSTNNAGNRLFQIYRGDGTSALSWQLAASTGNSVQTGSISWDSGTSFPGILTHTNTASRTYIFQDAAGTIAQSTNNLGFFAATTSAQLAGIISDETGSGALVFATSPALTTPALGVATATSINKVAITAPATSATLTIADGKTLTVSNTLTFTGTDGTSFAFPATSSTVATLGVTQTFTGDKTFSGNNTQNGFLSINPVTSRTGGAATVTISTSSISGTTNFTTAQTGNMFVWGLMTQTISGSAAQVIPMAATLYVSGAPVAGVNTTITAPHSLHIEAGDSYFGGALKLVDTFVERVSPTANKLIHFGAASGGATGVWVDTTTPGVVLRSPDNNYWRVTIDNAGAITTTSIGASLP